MEKNVDEIPKNIWKNKIFEKIIQLCVKKTIIMKDSKT